MLCAAICWISQLVMGSPAPAEGAAAAVEIGSRTLGNTFTVVFFLNLLVFAFDFSRIKSITLIAIVAALLLGLGWADSTWDIGGGIRMVLGAIDIRMNTQFYGMTTAFLVIVLLCVMINTRFNYYEINTREILHHHGYLGDITRMPTSNLRLNKEILRPLRVPPPPQRAPDLLPLDFPGGDRHRQRAERERRRGAHQGPPRRDGGPRAGRRQALRVAPGAEPAPGDTREWRKTADALGLGPSGVHPP